MAIKEYNVDLDVKGRILATDVPNSTGSIVTWNAATNVFGLRTNSQILSDLGLNTVVANSHTHTNKTVLDGITSANVSNWNTAFGWGNFRDYGLASIKLLPDLDNQTLGSIGFTSATTANSAGLPWGAVLNMGGTNSNNGSGFQIYGVYENTSGIKYRRLRNGVFGDWVQVIDSNNLNSQATSLGFIKSNTLSNYIPYTGATSAVDLNTQNLLLGGRVVHSPDTYTSVLHNTSTGNTSFRTHYNLGSISLYTNNNEGVVAVELPVGQTSSTWQTKISVRRRSTGSIGLTTYAELIISGYGSNAGRMVMCNNPDMITKVEYGTDTSINKTILLIYFPSTTTHLTASIDWFKHSYGYSSSYNDKSSYAINFVQLADIGALYDFVLGSTIENKDFLRDSYVLDYANFKRDSQIILNDPSNNNEGRLIRFAYTGNNRYLTFKFREKIWSTNLRMFINLTCRENIYGLLPGSIRTTWRIMSAANELKSIVSDSAYDEIVYYEDEEFGYLTYKLRSGYGYVNIDTNSPSYISDVLYHSTLDLTGMTNVKYSTIEVEAYQSWVINQLTSYVPTSRTLTAGNGLSGGGNLTANRTFTLGTPSSIGLSTTNAVTTSSHTHALDAETITAINNGQTAYDWGNHAGLYQPLNADLTSIAGLSGTTGLLRKTAANTWSLDTNTYLTENQSITLSGDITGSGTTSINTSIANNAVSFAKIQNIASKRILGRGATGTGNVQELTLGTGLTLSNAGVLSLSEDFIPLSGTAVGKPLTGNIEVDTSNGNIGFYSNQNGLERRISMTDDGFNTIQNHTDDYYTYFEQGSNFNFSQVRDRTTNERSQVFQTPQNTTITTIDADNNKAEIVVGGYGTVRFNSDIPGDNWSGYMFYNYEEGLQLLDNNSNNRGALWFNGIQGRYNTKSWQIIKNGTDSNSTYLLLPDSGATNRRIPVSVNGNYANAAGNITVPIPAQLNPTAGTGISITGTYPNLTFTNTAPNVTQNLSSVLTAGNTANNSIILSGGLYTSTFSAASTSILNPGTGKGVVINAVSSSIDFRHNSTYSARISPQTLTQNSTHKLQDKDGVIAHLSDIDEAINVRMITIELTHAQVLALNTTPYDITPAMLGLQPGEKVKWLLDRCEWKVDSNGVPYNGTIRLDSSTIPPSVCVFGIGSSNTGSNFHRAGVGPTSNVWGYELSDTHSLSANTTITGGTTGATVKIRLYYTTTTW